MMKRPRSFISTFLFILAVAIGSASIAWDVVPSAAAGLPHVLDPRAGDPSEPSEGFGSGDDSSSPDYLAPRREEQPRLAGPSISVSIRIQVEVTRFFARFFQFEGRR
jgi:hypothetical protein